MRKHQHRARIVGAIAVVSALAAPFSVARSQVEPPRIEVSEANRLGLEMAHAIFQNVDLKVLLDQRANELDHVFDEVKDRPEWSAFLKQAALEEAEAIHPMMERMIGAKFARYFTVEELRVGVAFLHGPAGKEISDMIGSGARGAEPKPFSPAVKLELARLGKQPAGRSWVMKLEKMDALMDEAEPDFVAAFVLGAFHRFTDKAEAAEAKRREGL